MKREWFTKLTKGLELLNDKEYIVLVPKRGYFITSSFIEAKRYKNFWEEYLNCKAEVWRIVHEEDDNLGFLYEKIEE